MSEPTGPSGPVFHGLSAAPAKRDAVPASAGRPFDTVGPKRGVGRITASRLSAGSAGAAADNAAGVIRPTDRKTAQPRHDIRLALIRRLGGAPPLARILGSVHQQATNRQQSLAEKPAPSFFRNQLPTIPWDAAKPLIHGLPEILITSSPTDLSTGSPGKPVRRQRPMKIGTAPALKQTTKISGASVQAGWGIPPFTSGGRRSIRAQPPHPFRGPRYRQAENSPLLCPPAAQRPAPPPSRLGTSVQAG